MWIFAREGFLSIVQHRDHEELLVVRGRFRGGIEALFPDAEVEETPKADYRYRTIVQKGAAARRIAEAVLGIDYENFKGSLDDLARHDTYTDVWAVMLRAQEQDVLVNCLDGSEQYDLGFWPDDQKLFVNGPDAGPFYIPGEDDGGPHDRDRPDRDGAAASDRRGGLDR